MLDGLVGALVGGLIVGVVAFLNAALQRSHETRKEIRELKLARLEELHTLSQDYLEVLKRLAHDNGADTPELRAMQETWNFMTQVYVPEARAAFMQAADDIKKRRQDSLAGSESHEARVYRQKSEVWEMMESARAEIIAAANALLGDRHGSQKA